MIALKTNHGMSTDILTFDSALLSPTDQSFINGGPQTQHYSEITSLDSEEWLQDFDDIRRFCDDIELSLNYEPELSLEAMTKEVETQYQSKDDDIIDYLDSTAFLSPESIEPASPQYAVQDTAIDSETAITLLEEILVANAETSLSSDQCFESELTIPFASEDSEVSVEGKSPVAAEVRPKRQSKRKIREDEVEVVSPSKAKRGKTSEAKRERKRCQNKCAANRYRQKKRAELDGIDHQHKQMEDANALLRAQLQKLQMEFKVVYPLAKTAFASDPNRSLQLQMLDIRVLNDELLE